MRKRQFRYILPFLILALFVFATVLNSQEPTEESTEKPKQTEQSQPEKITEETETAEQPQDEEKSEETEVPKPTPENSIPSESQSDTTTDYIENLQSSSDTSTNSFQYFLLIIAFIILNTVFVVFFLRHIVRKQQEKLEKIPEQVDGKLNERQKSLGSRLTLFIGQKSDDITQKLEEMDSKQTLMNDMQKKHKDTIASIDNRFENIDNTLEELKIDRETPMAPDSSEDNEMDVETTILQTQEQADKFILAYKDGEPIDLDKIDMTTPSQNKVLDLNWIARALSEWIIELEQSDEENKDLIQSLKYAMLAIKNKLKTIREESPFAIKPPNLETDLELDDVREQSIAYPAQLEGILLGYEIGRQFDVEEMNRFIKQFVKDSLFNNVANHIPHDQLQEQLDRFLKLADFEVIPVEVGVTEVNSHYHDIQGSKQTEVKRGTVAEVISPGLMQKADNFIVQKPVVIRGE